MYRYHPQRVVAKNANPERNPSTDAAVIHLIREHCNSRYQSDVLYEYKPVIHPDVENVQSAFLIELYLQAHYTMRTETTSEVLACLTDLHIWHYFMLKLDSSQKIRTLWYFKIKMKRELIEQEVKDHAAFLCNQKNKLGKGDRLQIHVILCVSFTVEPL
jgi:hypothetical protein